LPVPIRTRISEQKSLQSQVLQTSATLRPTSSQDEFAKWAKLNRQHDKQIDDLKKVNSIVDGHKAKFQRAVRMTVWLGTTGIKGGVQWWYKKEPVFWLPAGTFPYWVEYIVAFPKAPKGIY
jgi:tail-anchored protein insertion receptor